MKAPICFAGCTFPVLVIAHACGLEPGTIDPGTSEAGIGLAVASGRYSAWSTPVNLGLPLNSASNDQGAFVSKDALSLYFVSTRPGGFGGQDIYVSQRTSVDDPWGQPQNVGPTINSSGNEASPTLSTNGHRLYFHCSRPGGFGGTDLYASRRRDKRDDFGWQPPQNLGGRVNGSGNERGLTLFEDDETGTATIYFDSDRSGGLGGVDIYATTLSAAGSLGPAVLVPELSSPSNDLLPGIRRDGLEIFLDSDRPGTVGLRDIWVSTRRSTSDPWSIPVNLGAVVNSAALDARAALSFDGTSLYFHSGRPGGLGDFDIYVSTRTKLDRDGGDDGATEAPAAPGAPGSADPSALAPASESRAGR
jgi:Tol biopolymer transport system component